MLPLPVATLEHALRVAGYRPGERFELGAKLEGRGGMSTVWLDLDAEGLEQGARWVSARNGERNLYFVANPVRRDVVKQRAKRAENEDCARGEVLLLDVDPVKVKQKDIDKGKAKPEDLDDLGTRPAKLELAVEIGDAIRQLLHERTGALAPLVSSGRGRQLWLRIEGELDAHTRRRVVHALAARFDRPGLVTLDRATHNVARLMRLPGSVNLRTGALAEVLDDGNGQLAKAGDLVALLAELEPKKKGRRSGASRRARTGEGGTPRRQAGQHADRTLAEQSARAWSALQALDADDYEAWIEIGQALHASELPDAYEMWDRWSATSSSYEGEHTTAYKWSTFKAGGGRGIGSLFHHAIQAGWSPPPPSREEEARLPLIDVRPRERIVPSRAEAEDAARRTVCHQRRRGDAGPVAQDRRPTGNGKTTGAAKAVVDDARPKADHDEKPGRFVWASPNHDHGRGEALLALAKAGAAIWDEDLDGGDGGGVRPALREAGAEIVPLGLAPQNAHTPTAAKVPPFDCPGPALPGMTSEDVNRTYQEVAGRGWNPAATVCRACPRFLTSDEDTSAEPCTYWERRREAAKADILVLPHHALRPEGAAVTGRRGVVIDEDPGPALIKRLQLDDRSARSFAALLDAALEVLGVEAQITREELDELEATARGRAMSADEQELRESLDAKLQRQEARVDVVSRQVEEIERVLAHLRAKLECWDRAQNKGELPFVCEVAQPEGVDVGLLASLQQASRACERALRHQIKTGERLTDRAGKPVGAARNLLPFVRCLVRSWAGGAAAILHAKPGAARPGRKRKEGPLPPPVAVVPVVEELPQLPTLALDATGDPRLLELATGRDVRLIEGEATARIEGLHLVDVPCGRGRYRRRKTGRGGRRGDEALAEDAALVVRYARRKKAKRIGLVTFKAFAAQLEKPMRAAGLEVRTLTYGNERGRNDFQGWADLVVVLGTPFVPPHEVRLRAHLEGAPLEELLEEPQWELRRLPEGGTASILVQPGAASQRAYDAIVSAQLEQALGRALRWDWTPPAGALVLAQPWRSLHSLRLSTRHREGLSGPGAELVELLETEGEDVPLEAAVRRLRELVTGAGGTVEVARVLGVSPRAVRLWVSGECWPEPENVRALLDLEPASLLERACGEREENRDVQGGGTSGHRDELIPVFAQPEQHQRAGVHPCSGSAPLKDVFMGALPDIGMNAPCQSIGGIVESDPRGVLERAIELAGGKTRLLAEAVGFRADTLRKWRRGEREIGAKSLETLRAWVESTEAARVQQTDSQAASGGTEEKVEPSTDEVADRGPIPERFPESGCQQCGGLVGPRRCWGPPESCAVELTVVPAGSNVPGIGRVYTDVAVPQLRSAPEPAPTKREEVARGLEELRAWVDPTRHPGWLRRAAVRGKGLSSLATWIGTRKRGELREVDQDLALARAQELGQQIEQPLAVRRLWVHVCGLLVQRGAQSTAAPPEGLRRNGKRQTLQEARRAQAKCGACDGSGCGVCRPGARRGQATPPRRVSDEPIVQAAREELNGREVRRGRRHGSR